MGGRKREIMERGVVDWGMGMWEGVGIEGRVGRVKMIRMEGEWGVWRG